MSDQYLFTHLKIGGEEVQTVRVKSPVMPDLVEGAYVEVVESDEFMVVTQTFKTSSLIKRDTDAEENHYAWYRISEHTKSVDHTPAVKATAAQNAANIDYLSMMVGIDLPEEKENSRNEQ